jgi:integrase
MGRRAGNGAGRVHGPYSERGRWRVVAVDAEGKRSSLWYATERLAQLEAAKLRKQVEEIKICIRSVDDALDEYQKHLEATVQEHTQQQNLYRLRWFFHGELEQPVRAFTRERCQGLYDAMRTRPGQLSVEREKPKPLSVASQRDCLGAAKTFFRWCVGQGWLASSPAEQVKGQGKRNRGKPQLHVDEARRWVGLAMEQAADPGKRPGVAAALLTLLTNLRCCEIVRLQVRDVDDGGRLLWIERSKTEAGKRRLRLGTELSEGEEPGLAHQLSALLAGLAADRPGGELLFGEHWRDWPRLQVQRICREAGVPVVSAQSMRGLHASLAMEDGMSIHAVVRSMGHTGPAVTLGHYARPEAVAAGQQRTVLQVLQGGKR